MTERLNGTELKEGLIQCISPEFLKIIKVDNLSVRI